MSTSMQSKISRFKKFIAINIWVQKLYIRGYGWKRYILYSIIDISKELSPYVNVYMLGQLINLLANNTAIEGIYPILIYWGLINGIIAFLTTGFGIQAYYDDRFLIDTNIHLHLVNKLNELDWEKIENPDTEKLINQFIRRSRFSIKNLFRLHTMMIQSIFGLIFALSIAKINLFIIGIIIVSSLPQLMAKTNSNAKQKKISDKNNVKNNISWNMFNYIRVYSTLYEIKIANATSNFINRFKKSHKEMHQEYMDVAREDSIRSAIFHPLRTIGMIATYIFPLQSFFNKGLSLGDLQISIGTINRLSTNLYRVMYGIESSVQHFRYAEYAYDFFQIKNDRINGRKEVNQEKIPTIEFKNVSFKYPGAEKFALKNISLKISPSEKIAFVGENGAGKTTFLKLLLGVYSPTEGEILINGISLSVYDRNKFRDIISYMSQDSPIFSALSAKENVTIYNKINSIEEEKFVKALEMAEAKDFVSKLKNKENTLLNRIWEGEDISGGQKQRLAIARQFYSSKPIVILDEPTSAIDPVSESKIFDNLYHHLKNKTVLVVSHRYNTVRAAKEILVFKNGQIIEKGSHSELIKQKGYYENAYKLQNSEKKL